MESSLTLRNIARHYKTFQDVTRRRWRAFAFQYSATSSHLGDILARMKCSLIQKFRIQNAFDRMGAGVSAWLTMIDVFAQTMMTTSLLEIQIIFQPGWQWQMSSHRQRWQVLCLKPRLFSDQKILFSPQNPKVQISPGWVGTSVCLSDKGGLGGRPVNLWDTFNQMRVDRRPRSEQCYLYFI